MPVDIPSDRRVHETTLKVRFYELDPYDHVNHTNYFSYFETARVELLAELGFGLDYLKEQGFQIVVVEINARFHAAARYGEQLTVYTWVESVGRVQSTWRQVIKSDERVMVSQEVHAATTGLDGRPRRAPQEFVERLAALTA